MGEKTAKIGDAALFLEKSCVPFVFLKVDRAALQAELDRLVQQAHERATGAVDSPLGEMPPPLAQRLGPILAAAGHDVEPSLAGLREQPAEMGADESQIDEVIEMIHSGLKTSPTRERGK